MKYQGDDLLAFPSQIVHALNHFDSVDLSKIKNDVKHVVVCGLGGSGIAGRLIKAFFLNRSQQIIEIVSDYSLPTSVSSDTLVICSSYSGNTEETLACFAEATSKGCQIVAISSGGILSDEAKRAGLPLFISPGGFQPRMALGYSLTYLFLFLGKLSDLDLKPELNSAASALINSQHYQNLASSLLTQLDQVNHNYLQMVTDGVGSAVALRFQQQLNENSKIWAQVHEMPEMCHNVIEAITKSNVNGPWLLINSGLNDRINVRFNFLADLLKSQGYTYQVLNIDTSTVGTLLDTIYTLDWFSLLLADAHNINSSLIPNILSLKALLSK